MTMAASVNSVAAILFLVSWAMYLVSEAARTGATSKPQCDNDSDDVAAKLCSGYAAAAVWFIFSVVIVLVAAGLSTQKTIRTVLFVVSLALAALAYVCEYGGLTSAVNEGGSKYYGDEYNALQTGYGAATVFFFFAFLAAIVCAVFVGKFADRMWMAILTFFVFLATWALALTGAFGGESKYNCDASGSGDIGDAQKSYCDGYGFAAFATVVAMLGSFWFAFLAFKSREDTHKVWVGWFIFAMVLFIAYTSHFAANAQVYCNYITDNNNDKQCQGYSAAAFFVMLAAVASLAGLVLACKEMHSLTHTMFMAAFALFFLAYACYLGGQSVYNCKQYDDNADKGGVDQGYDALCDGYGAGTFFAIVAFVVSTIGVYFAYQGGDEVPHEQMHDSTYPSEGMPPTTVGHTIDDDYNKA